MKQKRNAGIFAIFFAVVLAVMGNLAGAGQVWNKVQSIGKPTGFIATLPIVSTLAQIAEWIRMAITSKFPFPDFDYWGPSRVMAGSINEFPFFSFLFADLHPHMIGIPFTLLFIAFGVNIVLGKKKAESNASLPTAELTVISMDTSLEESLPKRVVNILAKNNIVSFEQLRASTPEEISSLEGLGGKSRELINQLLLQPSLSLATPTRETTFDWKNSVQQVLQPLGKKLPLLALGGFLLGGVFVINMWDVVGMLSLLFVCYSIANGFGSVATWGARVQIFVQSLGESLISLFFGIAFFSPFLINFYNPTGGIGFWNFATPPSQYFTIFGFFLVIILWFISVVFFQLLREKVVSTTQQFNLIDWGIVVTGCAIAGFLVFKFGSLIPLSLLLVLLILALIAIGWQYRDQPSLLLGIIVVILALGITLGTEFVYLKDHMDGGDYRRMNTIFKFYNQAWILMTIGTAILLASLVKLRQVFQSRWSMHLGTTVTLFFFALGMVYPALGTGARIDDRFPAGQDRPTNTLDGLAFMRSSWYTYPDVTDKIELSYELEAIDWINANIKGMHTVMDAGCFIGFYREMGGKVGGFTGMSNLAGMHESEQRNTFDRGARCYDIFRTDSWEFARSQLEQYGVEYIYLGQLEYNSLRDTPVAYNKFIEQEGKELGLVFSNDKVKLYRILPRQH